MALTERFVRNVAEARDNGYDLVCVLCGCGMNDEDFEDSDAHDIDCANRGRDRAAETLAMIESRLA